MFNFNKNTIILVVASIVIIIGFLYLVFTSSNTPTQSKTFDSAKKLTENDHIKWSQDKKILLVEYSDYQCPNCKLWSDFFKQQDLSNNPNFEKIKEKITFVYRHFPLDSIHKNALSSAYAAEAAGLQGKFFEMSDLIFEKQEEWAELKDPTNFFIGLAKSLKLNEEKFKTDMESSEIKKKVQEDKESGVQASVNSTASFYLNGVYLDKLSSTQDLLNILLKEVSSK
ncbi:MAG: thioredoxin domain-containing protein [bacterium]|nr:thioredoxin domain-containing protein [bacterium]